MWKTTSWQLLAVCVFWKVTDTKQHSHNLHFHGYKCSLCSLVANRLLFETKMLNCFAHTWAVCTKQVRPSYKIHCRQLKYDFSPNLLRICLFLRMKDYDSVPTSREAPGDHTPRFSKGLQLCISVWIRSEENLSIVFNKAVRIRQNSDLNGPYSSDPPSQFNPDFWEREKSAEFKWIDLGREVYSTYKEPLSCSYQSGEIQCWRFKSSRQIRFDSNVQR